MDRRLINLIYNNNSHFFKFFICAFTLLLHLNLYSQKTTKIELIQANTFEFDKNIGKDVRRFIGDVIFKHDNTYMHCDSAYLYTKTNNIDAFNNIHIIINDSIHIYGDILNYDGNNKIAKIHNNVKLVDNQMILTTEHLIYNIKTNISHYYTGGKIVKEDNILTSVLGHYYAVHKDFFFKDSVVLINPENIINSDTLKFNTVTEVAYFYGPTTIEGKENFIYCENGWYNTKDDIAQFKENAFLKNEEQTLSGDSIYYNRIEGIGMAFDNITITDSVQNIIIKGNYAEYYEVDEKSLITDSAMLILIDENDSLFLHADTLISIYDSTKTYKTLFAYHKTKFFKKDLQGISDSVVYTYKDSLITFYDNPIIWSEQRQMTADLIKMKLNENEIEKMFFYNSSFIISRFDSLRFDQIKGKDMLAYFTDNELKKIFVKGNAETIYFLCEEDSSITGVNKSESESLMIYVKDNEVEKITFFEQPNATLHPPKEISSEKKFLKNFIWEDAKRPKNILDIFIWKN